MTQASRRRSSRTSSAITCRRAPPLRWSRQQDLFAGSGWAPSRSTLLNIAESAGDLLPPFIDDLRDAVLASEVVGTDDTRVTLLLPAERQALRESDSQPIWTRLRGLLDGEAAKRVLPKEKIGEALGDLRNHWDALRLHLSNPPRRTCRSTITRSSPPKAE